VDARRGARVGGQLLGGGEPRNAAHLECDHEGEHEPDSEQGQEQLNGGRWPQHGLHLVLEPAHQTVQILDLFEKLLSGVRRTGRQELETLAEEGAAPHAEEIAHLQMMKGVLGQGGVNSIARTMLLAMPTLGVDRPAQEEAQFRALLFHQPVLAAVPVG
jgi:hypothetical protein